jgi:hypothetical protein
VATLLFVLYASGSLAVSFLHNKQVSEIQSQVKSIKEQKVHSDMCKFNYMYLEHD